MSKTLEEAWAELETDVDFNGAMRFAVSEIQELAVAAERERCAKVADERLRQSRMISDAGDSWFGKGVEAACTDIAATIRNGPNAGPTELPS